MYSNNNLSQTYISDTWKWHMKRDISLVAQMSRHGTMINKKFSFLLLFSSFPFSFSLSLLLSHVNFFPSCVRTCMTIWKMLVTFSLLKWCYGIYIFIYFFFKETKNSLIGTSENPSHIWFTNVHYYYHHHVDTYRHAYIKAHPN